MNPARYKFFTYQFPVILWALIILTVSSVPQFMAVQPHWSKYDKIVHFIEYGVFGFLLTRALYFQNNISVKKYSIVLAIVIGILFAGIDEIHQRYIPGRLESFGDFISDILGITAAQVFFIRKSFRHKDSL